MGISYKNHKTGKIRRWNLMESPFQEFPNGSYNQPGDVDSEVYNTHERERRQSNSDCQIENLKEVDRCQNQYMMLLFRYLQAKHGQEKVHGYLSKIMTFVLNLLTNSY